MSENIIGTVVPVDARAAQLAVLEAENLRLLEQLVEMTGHRDEWKEFARSVWLENDHPSTITEDEWPSNYLPWEKGNPWEKP